jgi:thiamine-monophosphate kinase
LSTPDQRENWSLAGGDDYELLFTVSPERLLHLEAAIAGEVRCTPVGRLISGNGVQWCRHGEPVTIEAHGFDHFAAG